MNPTHRIDGLAWIEDVAVPGEVSVHGWSNAKRANTVHAGTDDLGAAVLVAGQTGFKRGSRRASTIDAIVTELGHGSLLYYRYTGMEREESALVAWRFWMVDALVRTNQTERARQLVEDAVALVNDVGLLFELITPDTGAFLGTMAQGLSRAALISASLPLGRFGDPSCHFPPKGNSEGIVSCPN